MHTAELMGSIFAVQKSGLIKWRVFISCRVIRGTPGWHRIPEGNFKSVDLGVEAGLKEKENHTRVTEHSCVGTASAGLFPGIWAVLGCGSSAEGSEHGKQHCWVTLGMLEHKTAQGMPEEVRLNTGVEIKHKG